MASASADEHSMAHDHDQNSKRTPPPAVRVAAGESIMAAVARASPGQTLLLGAGLFKEAVVIEKEVHITGTRKTVLECDTGTALEFKGPSASSVRGITIRSTAPAVAKIDLGIFVHHLGGEAQPAVRFTGGSPALLQDCDVSSSNNCGIHASGKETAPVLRANLVHDCGEFGIQFCAWAKGEIEENDVFGNANHGIQIQERANPVVRRNKVHHGKKDGIGIIGTDENGTNTYTLEKNEIFENVGNGITIATPECVIVHGNTVRLCYCGIHIIKSKRGTVEENDVFKNQSAGITLACGADPLVRRNKVHDQKIGIRVFQGGRGTIADNTLERLHPNRALEIDPSCTRCRVERNTIRNPKETPPDPEAIRAAQELMRDPMFLLMAEFVSGLHVDRDL